MATYNTGNPLGSSDPRDLYDTAEIADNLVNGAHPAYDDRLGQARKSWAGMEQDFADFLASSGYQFLGDYAAGIEITAYNQVVRESGEFWRAAAGTTLPYTTTGAGMPEGGAFAPVGDAVLRQELAASTTGQGSDLIGHTGTTDTVTEALNKRTIYVGSVAELGGVDASAGAHYSLTGYHADSDVGGGVFYWDESRDKADHNGGTVIDPDKAFPADWSNQTEVDSWFNTTGTGSGCYVRTSNKRSAEYWGLKNGEAYDQSVVIQALLDYRSSAGEMERTGVIPSGWKVALGQFDIPARTTLVALGCEITSLSGTLFTVNAKSKAYGFGTRIISYNSGDSASDIRCSQTDTVSDLVEILGFDMVGPGTGTQKRAVNLAGLYQSKVDVTGRRYDMFYYRSSTLACYYNEINVSVTNCNIGLFTAGSLFNGNTINVKRCNTNYRGIEVRDGTGNTINNYWIENVSDYGIVIWGGRFTTIVGGVIEGAAGANAGIRLVESTEHTYIFGVSFGSEFASSAKKVEVAGSTVGTTLITDDEVFLNVDGAITAVGGGVGNRVNGGSFRNSEPTILGSYKVAGLPSAADYNKGLVIVTDEAGGQIPCFSDGVNWRRVSDRAIVSAL